MKTHKIVTNDRIQGCGSSFSIAAGPVYSSFGSSGVPWPAAPHKADYVRLQFPQAGSKYFTSMENFVYRPDQVVGSGHHNNRGGTLNLPGLRSMAARKAAGTLRVPRGHAFNVPSGQKTMTPRTIHEFVTTRRVGLRRPPSAPPILSRAPQVTMGTQSQVAHVLPSQSHANATWVNGSWVPVRSSHRSTRPNSSIGRASEGNQSRRKYNSYL